MRPPDRASRMQPLPKRVYERARSLPRGEKFEILLDGRSIKTPQKSVLMVPTHALAEAIVEEWGRQGERVDPATLPLTRLANTAIDSVTGREVQVRADILKHAASDLLCYRAEGPDALVERQATAWDPVLEWAGEALGARFTWAEGVMPVPQPAQALCGVAATLAGLDAFRLVGLHVMTTLMGSALLALAHARGRLTVNDAWRAAQVDEDWQIERWGDDTEAAVRRQLRREEMRAASRFLQLVTHP